MLSSSGEAFIRIGKKNILKVTLPNNGLANLLDKVFHRKSYSLKLPLQELYFRKTYPQSSDEYFFGINPFFEKKEGVLDLVSGKQSGKEEKCPLFSYRLVPFKEPIVNPYKELIKELNYETGFRLKVTKISHKAFNI